MPYPTTGSSCVGRPERGTIRSRSTPLSFLDDELVSVSNNHLNAQKRLVSSKPLVFCRAQAQTHRPVCSPCAAMHRTTSPASLHLCGRFQIKNRSLDHSIRYNTCANLSAGPCCATPAVKTISASTVFSCKLFINLPPPPPARSTRTGFEPDL